MFFSIDSASCSDHSHSQRDGNSRLLFLQLVIPKFADIWGNSDYYPCFQLLPTGRVPSTSYDQSSQRNKCLLGRFMCVQLSNCANFLITPTGTGALGKLKIHVWEMLSTHRRYYNDYSYSERGRCLLLSSRIMFVFQCF